MFAGSVFEVFGFVLDLITLSDTAFYNLLSLLLVLALIRVLLPVHNMMVKELAIQNEVVDFAEQMKCTEFDVFVKAVEYYSGVVDPQKAKKDFAVYLYNWPENYVLPYYVKLYLKIQKNSHTGLCQAELHVTVENSNKEIRKETA